MLNRRMISVSIVPLLVVITAVLFFVAAPASGDLDPSLGADAGDAARSGVRGVPHPGLYQLPAGNGSMPAVRGVPHPGLYRLPAADAPDAIGSGVAGCSSSTTARPLGVDGGLMGLLFARSAQTTYAAPSVNDCTMAFGASGS